MMVLLRGCVQAFEGRFGQLDANRGHSKPPLNACQIAADCEPSNTRRRNKTQRRGGAKSAKGNAVLASLRRGVFAFLPAGVLAVIHEFVRHAVIE